MFYLGYSHLEIPHQYATAVLFIMLAAFIAKSVM